MSKYSKQYEDCEIFMKLFHSELQKTNSKCGKNIIHKKEIATPKDHECTNCVQS